MSVVRNTAFYPSNGTVVDSGSGINIAAVFGVPPGSLIDNVATATHTQDNAERTFQPGSSAANADAHQLQRLGWAREVAHVTPDDDVRGNAYLPAGTYRWRLWATMTMAGGTLNLGGTHTPTFKAGLWRYNPSTNAGVLIATSTVRVSQSWDTGTLGDAGTFKSVELQFDIASDVELQDGETMLMQIGLNVGTLTNPALGGTTTFTFTLRFDVAGSTRFRHLNDSDSIFGSLYRESESGNSAAAANKGRTTIFLAPRQAFSAAGAAAERFLTAFRADSASSAAAAAGSKHIRMRPIAAASAADAFASKYIRLSPREAFSAAAAFVSKYIRLAPREAFSAAAADARRRLMAFRFGSAASVAGAFGRRVLEARRVGTAYSVAAAQLFLQMSQDVLNRLEGGATTIIRRAKKVIFGD